MNPSYSPELESEKQIIKDAHKITREARKERDYYKGLAGMYQLTYDDDTAIHQAIIILQGIWVELQGDLLQFKIKNGLSDRVNKSQARLNLMGNQFKILSAIQTSNIALKANLRDAEAKIYLQHCQIKDLKNQLQLHTENL
jgi:capsule polysaccharide export protein KpsE/RkpR